VRLPVSCCIIFWLQDNGLRPTVPGLSVTVEISYHMRFSPDGTLLAHGSVGLLDTTTWQVRATLKSGTKPSTHYDVAFSPDGKTLASGSGDTTVVLWTYEWGVLARRLCHKVGRNLSRSEWETFVQAEGYQRTCPEWP
jgi:WD40 repeat protein